MCKRAVLWVLLVTCVSAVSAVAQPFAGVQSSTPPRVESLEQRSLVTPIKYTPERSTLAGIVVWLADNFNLPNIHEYPDIQFAPAEDLIGMKYNSYFKGRSGAESQDTRPDQYEIEAVYNDVLKTIFLRLECTGKTPAEQVCAGA